MRIPVTITALLVAMTVTASAQSRPTTKGSIVGTWVKDHTRIEDHGYPADAEWQLEVTFSSDGTFAWQSTRTVKRTEAAGTQAGKIVESVKGKYVKKGYLITYEFDSPSELALKQLPQFFAFWPGQLRGQQTFSFRDGFLRLGNDGGKAWIFLKRKEAQSVEQPPAN
jgi:hypothetical protein